MTQSDSLPTSGSKVAAGAKHLDWKRLLPFSVMLVVIGGVVALLALLFSTPARPNFWPSLYFRRRYLWSPFCAFVSKL